jgi:hypothetical protein
MYLQLWAGQVETGFGSRERNSAGKKKRNKKYMDPTASKLCHHPILDVRARDCVCNV